MVAWSQRLRSWAPWLRSGARRLRSGAQWLWRRRTRAVIGVVVCLTVLVVSANAWIWGASAGRIQELGAPDDTATAPVAIVLGAAVRPSGEPSPWLRYRLDTAARLYRSGRVEAILVSGDNGQENYNEPVAMRRYLVAAGIPDEAIALDYAGFDTYDTCVRARRIFGVTRAIIVTQDFHEPRAVSVCRAAGIEASGVADTLARNNRGTWTFSWLRERVAAVKAAWDVLSGREPLLGRRETSVTDAIAWTRAHRTS